MTSNYRKRPLFLLFLLGVGTGLIALAVSLLTGYNPARALGVGLAYLCGVFLGGWLTMGAVSALGRFAMFMLDRQQAEIDRVMDDTEQVFDRVDILRKTVGRDRLLRPRRMPPKSPGPPPPFVAAISGFLWKVSPYTCSIGILWTSCGLIVLGLHRLGGLGNPLALYALPVGGLILLSLAFGIYLAGYLRLWRLLRRGKYMRKELLSIEQELTAEPGNRRG